MEAEQALIGIALKEGYACAILGPALDLAGTVRARRHCLEFLDQDRRQMHSDGFTVLGVAQIERAAPEIKIAQPRLVIEQFANASARVEAGVSEQTEFCGECFGFVLQRGWLARFQR